MGGLASDGQIRRADGESPFVEETLEIEDRIVSVHLAPVYSTLEFLGTVSVFRDITRESEVARMKSDFVSIVSHEMRTPMTSIKGFVDLMLMGAAGDVSDQQRHFLSIIKSNADRLAILVSDLLDLSKIETGRLRLRLEPTSALDVLEGVIDSLRGSIEDKEQELTCEVSDNLPLVMADRDRLIQVLTNLLANANQYTPNGGQIRIKMVQQGPVLQISVADTGIGISEEDQEKIFNRFFRADHPLVRNSEGTGLGLPIVRSLVEMHGGELWLHSTLGEGSEFSFTLPVTCPEEEMWVESVDETALPDSLGADGLGSESEAATQADDNERKLVAGE